MNDLQVKNIGFYGGEILGVKTPSGKIYMGVRQACRDIGLTEDQARRQVKNIQTDLVLNKGVSNLALPTRGGIQEVLGVEIGFIPLWLAKISITPRMREENPQTVERLVKYQLEAKDVLEKVFVEKKQIIPKDLSPELQFMIKQELKTRELEEKTQILEHRVNSLDATNINGTPRQRLNDMVRKYAYDRGVLYPEAWKRFRKNFNTAYKTNLELKKNNYLEKHNIKKMSFPEYMERVGLIEDALRVADKMLNE